jgi:predicted nucleotide-binding protein
VDVDVGAQLRRALTYPDVFKKVYEKFNKKNIPREDVFKSTLKKDYGIESVDLDTCYDIIMENIQDYGLAQEIKGNTFLSLDKLGGIIQTSVSVDTEELIEPSIEETQIMSTVSSKPETQIPKQIFVAHGKNTKPLEQLKGILDQFQVPYKIAIDEPNAGRPVSKKVSDLMQECSSAIFIFTKDEETKDLEGRTIYRPSDNVVFELGAASVLYEKKIVIFKENGVSFGSDFKDLGYISFDTDQLGAKTVDLMKELIRFGLLKISAA